MEQWNAKLQFPTDSDYICRFTTGKNKDSKNSGNTMLELEAEVVLPESRMIGDTEVGVSGVSCTCYYVTTVYDGEEVDNEKTKAARERCMKYLFTPLEIPESEIDWENVDIKGLLLNKPFYAQMAPDVVEDRKDPTPAQIEAAKKTGQRALGDIQKHPVTGKPLVKYWPKIKEIFGRAPEDSVANKPY